LLYAHGVMRTEYADNTCVVEANAIGILAILKPASRYLMWSVSIPMKWP
jgi:hypothetical protein